MIPAQNTSSPDLANISIRCPDQLIAYDEQYGLFDVSYAAAWQLGQLLALQDQKFAISLFNWKRSNIQRKIQDDQIAFYSLFFSNEDKNINDDLDFTKDQDITALVITVRDSRILSLPYLPFRFCPRWISKTL